MSESWQWADFYARWAMIGLWYCWACSIVRRIKHLESIGVRIKVSRPSDITSLTERKH